jgi:hypothetical protein
MTLYHLLSSTLLVLVLTLSVQFQAQASVYYINQKHPEANDQNVGSIDRPWKTIAKANQTLIAGDIVYIKEGTYTSQIAPKNSGNSSNSIIYRKCDNDAVTISDTTYGISLKGKSFIIVEGINFYNVDQFLEIRNGHHNTIADCNFDQYRRRINWSGSQIIGNSSFNRVHHCRFSKYGECNAEGEDNGSVLDIGSEESMTPPSKTPDHSDYNLIENNIMYHGGHHVLGVFGRYNVIRDNYIHNEAWTRGKGNRNIYLAGYPVDSGWNLIEGNQIGYSAPPCDSWGVSGTLLASGYNVVRRNRFYYNDLAGIAMSVTSTYYSDIVYNKIYNNSFFHNGWNMSQGPDAVTSAIAFVKYSGPLVIKYNAIKNNLYKSHYQAYGYYYVNSGDQLFAGNWNGDTQGDPKFVNASKVFGDPMDSTYPNLNLKADSPCIDAGTYLTTVTSTSGSGKSLKVADSRYFTDGWGITGVQGDEIQLYGTSQRARIIKIDYSNNTITVDTDLTWTQNQGVSLVYEGSGPDIGAHEYEQNLPTPLKNLKINN